MVGSRKVYSLVLLRDGNRILLGLKKRGFGVGKWNGFGGKLEKGETPLDSAHRELKEESSLECSNLTQRAVIELETEGQEEIMEVHVFHGSIIHGEPTESDEMRPAWFVPGNLSASGLRTCALQFHVYEMENIPYEQMWLEAATWWPHFLRGEKFKAWFLYHGYDTILDHKITPTDKF